MKKLSDYRIREENGKFVVEGRIEITERRFLRKFVNFEWHGLNVYGEVAGFCHQFDGSNVKIYTTLEDAKAQIIKWCEEPKYHYVREFEGYSYSPNFSKGCPWDFADFYKEQLSYGDIEYLAKCKAEKEKPSHTEEAMYSKTEQQMKEEITEQDVVGACKKQFDEKLPSFKDCGYKSLCTLPLTVEEKNLELQLEKAQYEKRIERLNILCCELIEENRKLKKEIEIIRYNSENVIKSYIYENEPIKRQN